jgi:hypothetical protein
MKNLLTFALIVAAASVVLAQAPESKTPIQSNEARRVPPRPQKLPPI